MVFQAREGSIQFSIEMDSASDRGRCTGSAQPQLVERFRRIFTEYGIPLTWFLPSGRSATAALFPAALGTDEVAWSPVIDTSSGPPRLREIKEQISQGLASFSPFGISVESCLLPDVWGAPQALDWLAEGGVRVLRAARQRHHSNRPQARQVRDGMWQVHVAGTLPGYGRGFGLAALDAGFAAKQALLRALQGEQAVHIAIPGDERVMQSERFWSQLRRLLVRVHRLRQASRIRCTTLSQTASVMNGARATSGRSVLRAA